ncbi:MAG TPA: hypothetical protein PKM41_14485 [Deltaproteobacteria bacterium]|nr:hypothetical protein [Deltaproteobacteria bacterium]HOI08275.1 hypothetical protein [Deltaproteobacteria bacterium]
MKNFLVASTLLILLLTGCSNDSVFRGMADDSSRDSTIEDAAIALDEQDYDSVINDLIGMYDTTNPDPEISRLLASAYMGKAGIDVTKFIGFEPEGEEDIFDIFSHALNLGPSAFKPNDHTTSEIGECNIEDLTVLLTSSGGKFIDGHCVAGMMSYLDKAKRALYLLHTTNRNTPDDTIQYGIVSAFHFAIVIGNDTADALNITLGTLDPKPGNVPIPLNKRAYYLYRNVPIWSYHYNMSWSRISTHSHAFGYEPLSLYQEDLFNMLNAVEAFDLVITGDNEVKGNLESLLRDILQNPDGDIENSILTMTTAGITGYIQNVLSVE